MATRVFDRVCALAVFSAAAQQGRASSTALSGQLREPPVTAPPSLSVGSHASGCVALGPAHPHGPAHQLGKRACAPPVISLSVHQALVTAKDACSQAHASAPQSGLLSL